MASIKPFQGLRFSDSNLSPLVAPPYDVLSESERDEHASRSAHNIVHLTLPKSEENDRSKFVKYAKSAALLEQWVQSGAMKKEATPTFYRYRQTFLNPYGGELVRESVIALIKVEPYENGVVLPHEQTFPKHKEDRLRLLEATRSHLECIFGLYEDPNQAIFRYIANAPSQELEDVTTEDGVRHQIFGISEPAATAEIQKLIADRKVWIADGHHRYETALNFRKALGDQLCEVAEDYMMMALSSMEDPGLVLLPTHRILKQDPGEIRSKLAADYWDIVDCPNDQLMSSIEKIGESGVRAFGVALPGGNGFVLKIDDLDQVVSTMNSDGSTSLKSLDVSILHDVIFARHLGLTGLDFFGYTRDPQEALDAVKNGAPATFLMNAPTVHDMRVIANGGEKMPQKSTYYYPKILSGLVLWRLSDF